MPIEMPPSKYESFLSSNEKYILEESHTNQVALNHYRKDLARLNNELEALTLAQNKKRVSYTGAG